jgi:signal peptide peptidase SppA
MYERILAEVLSLPWAITPEYRAIVARVLARRIAGDREINEESAAQIRAGQERAAARGASARVGDIAVMPILGVMLPRGEAMETSGAVSTQTLAAQFDALIADPSVGAVVLDFDSPGGSVGGVAEFGDRVFDARQKKPVIALARPMMASAAYWIGAQASELIVTPSSLSASIGVYAMHQDLSEFLAQAGVKVELIAYGENKTLGNPYEPLSPEGRAEIKHRVDMFGELFTKAVARGRGVAQKTVRDSFGGGKVFGAEEAVKIGIADSIGTLDDAIAIATRKAKSSAMRAENADPMPVAATEAEEPLPVAAGLDVEVLRARHRLAELA